MSRVDGDTYDDKVINVLEDLKFDLQYAIRAAMKEKSVKSSDLARSLGVTAGRITQILAEDANPSLETIARVLAALDENVSIASDSLHGSAVVDGVRDRSDGFFENTCRPVADVQFVQREHEVEVVEAPAKFQPISFWTEREGARAA